MRHNKVVTDDGWVDCSCGWESNHPLDDNDDPDPDHVGNDLPWVEHVQASIRAEVEAELARVAVLETGE